jgi:uncharacterized protein (DUF885 family)
MTLSNLPIAVFVLLLAWFLYSFIRGKPWDVRLLFIRSFLHLALKGPELLTLLGILEKFGFHAHNARLSDASMENETRTFRWVKRDLAILRSYPRRRQSPATLLSIDIMDWFMDDLRRSERFRFHDYPLNQMAGIQSELPSFMLTIHPLVSRLEARNYIRRLARFGVKFDQVLEGLKMRRSKGILPPKFVIRRVLDEMTAFIASSPAENPLCRVFDEKMSRVKKISPADREKLRLEVEAEIARTVYPAYHRLIDYFTSLETLATDDDGAWKHPDGEAYYAHCLRSFTTTDLTPGQVHALGLAEVDRIEAEMRSILSQLGYPTAGSPTAVLAELGGRPEFRYPQDEDGRGRVLADYQRILDDMDARLGPYFSLRPKAALKVERVPEFRQQTAPDAYYQPADLGGARPGIFFVNLRSLAEVRKFGMKTLACHEGIPGHHFQLAIAQGLKGLPFFRRMIPFTAYVEGWALYAEKLAREIGFYADDPFGELGYLDSELFRAVRLVVDTGIHALHWTRRQAIDYMQAHTAVAPQGVVAEVERYIVNPGQACAYKIGEIRMLDLREKMKTGLGNQFDLRRFHDLVLGNGAMPFILLERVVDSSIASAG